MIIVNFATKEFKKGQDRLMKSIEGKAHGLFLNDHKSIGSPTHQQSPYEFKIHSIVKAWEQFPNEKIVLWCDSSLWLVGDLSKIEKIIQEDGYFFEEAGHYVNDWTNQHTRKYFNLYPEENYTMFSAGLVGLDKTSPVAMSFFAEWRLSAKAGCFKGDWSNHRHDMSAGSIIASRMGMKYQRGGSHMAYIGDGYQEPEPGAVFYLQGI
jgi:hypothetical protein